MVKMYCISVIERKSLSVMVRVPDNGKVAEYAKKCKINENVLLREW